MDQLNQSNTQKRRGGAISQRPYGITLPNLRDWRMYRNMTQTELGRVSGVTNATVNKIETAGKSTSFSTVRKLADALTISMDDLRYKLPPHKQPAKVTHPTQ
jgi:transcriptional regulator with XRE-family HTH domain